MAPLLQLPDDIFLNMFEYLECDRPTLYVLSLVSRRLNELSREWLYRDISDVQGNSRNMLERNFAQKPTLRSFVRSCGPVCIGPEGEASRESLDECLRYPSLNSLRISRPLALIIEGTAVDLWRATWSYAHEGTSTRRTDLECAFLDKFADRLINMKKVYLDGTKAIDGEGRSIGGMGVDFTSTEIIRFMHLRNIYHLQARGLGKLRAPQLSELPLGCVDTVSKLTSLDIAGGRFWNVEPATLRQILSHCPQLRQLSCQVPVLTRPVSIAASQSIQQLCSSDLSWMLELVQRTLQSLALTESKDIRVEYDGSRLDLSKFRSLRTIRMSSCHFFPPGPFLERPSICRLLPRSLTFLQLDFPKSSGIFYCHWYWDRPSFSSLDPNNIPGERYGWLLQFTEEKPTHFPHLNTVKMTDPQGSMGCYDWLRRTWSPPAAVTALFHSQGIKLDLEISYPDPASFQQ